MEDPWGSPWTSESPPKIDLPAPPPSAHFSLENHNASINHRASGGRSPARSPWGGADDDENDAWGGWNDAGGAEVWRRRASPSLRPASGATSRLPSPSPWGAFGSLEDLPSVRDRERAGVEDDAKSTGAEEERAFGDEPRQADADVPVKSIEGGLGAPDDDGMNSDWTEEKPTLAKDDTLVSDTSATQLEDKAPPPAESPYSEGSQPSRHVSRVQVLVDHFDGISRRSESPVPVPKSSPDGRKEEEGRVEEDEDSAASSVEADAEDEAPEQDEPETYEEETRLEPAVSTTTSYEPPSTASRLPHIDISVDLSKLDDLFPSVDAAFPSPEPIPDVIIDDTFASISERRTWYRVSRYGSIRKHNQGDDDNYVTVTWPQSEVRSKAIRIVRRWMEEDSIAGRVVLGRRAGAVGASMFNWGSKAPQVEIGELLAKKSGRERSMSQGAKTAEPSPAAPVFGWGNPPPASPAASASSSAHAPQEVASPPIASPNKARFSLPPVPSTAFKHSLERPASITSRVQQKSAASQGASRFQVSLPDEGSDDDEWGDMVSPSVETHPKLPNGSAEVSSDRKKQDDAAIPPPIPPLDSSLAPTKSSAEVVTDCPKVSKDDGALAGSVDDNDDEFGSFESVKEGKEAVQPEPSTTATLSKSAFEEPVQQPIPVQAEPLSLTQVEAHPAELSEEDAARTVAEVLGNIPDLTYMLR
ncbi:hypothetical protein B0I35DRAFT_431986 [Stachybotrys elegans]|uniref:Uncharacterized protein n=1 Tax=Stachybotrys elegans TaxID=80388 RepID=A0A8K0SUP8_9HYPO|nr:hypothetical protein B0I35DRAFT_431986 [Stachybotrys elegans]